MGKLMCELWKKSRHLPFCLQWGNQWWWSYLKLQATAASMWDGICAYAYLYIVHFVSYNIYMFVFAHNSWYILPMAPSTTSFHFFHSPQVVETLSLQETLAARERQLREAKAGQESYDWIHLENTEKCVLFDVHYLKVWWFCLFLLFLLFLFVFLQWLTFGQDLQRDGQNGGMEAAAACACCIWIRGYCN